MTVSQRLINGFLWCAFSGALVLATAPVWRLWIFGFDPTLDQLLQLAICGGPTVKPAEPGSQ